MFDRQATALIKPAVTWLARRLAAAGVGANALTFAGFGIGVLAALLAAGQWYTSAAALVLLSRLLDALDGAVARQTAPTDRGGFMDITLDFLFYAAMPLAFAVVAAQRGMASTAYPDKSFFFLGGLTEGGETLAFFVAMCLWPQHFALLAWVFCVACVLTTATRLYWGWQAFK